MQKQKKFPVSGNIASQHYMKKRTNSVLAASRNLKEEASTHAIRDNDVQHGIPTVVFGRTYYFAFDSTEILQKKKLVVTGKQKPASLSIAFFRLCGTWSQENKNQLLLIKSEILQ